MSLHYFLQTAGVIGYFFVFPYLFVYNFAKLVAMLLEKPPEDQEERQDREGRAAARVLVSGFSLLMLFYLTGQMLR